MTTQNETYEYKTVKLPPLSGHSGLRRKRDRLLNEYAADGWELVDNRPKGLLEFGHKDVATLRRPRSEQ